MSPPGRPEGEYRSAQREGTPGNANVANPADLETRPRIGHGFRLQWEPMQDCHVLLYPEGMVKLNRSGGEILTRCDGQRSIAEITAELEQAFATLDLRADVLAFVEMARQQRWLVWE